MWPSSSFWPLLTSKYRSFIRECFTLNASQALTPGRNLSSFLTVILVLLVSLVVALATERGFRVLSVAKDLYVYENCLFWHWLTHSNSTCHCSPRFSPGWTALFLLVSVLPFQRCNFVLACLLRHLSVSAYCILQLEYYYLQVILVRMKFVGPLGV